MKETKGTSTGNKGLLKSKRVLIPLLLMVVFAGAGAFYWYMYLRGYLATDDAYIDADQISISSKILGRVVRIAVEEGDTATQGQLLAELDDSDLLAQEAQARAGLDYARQNVEVAEINLARAQDDFQRVSYQYENKVITREQFDHSRKALELAQAQHKVSLSQVNTAQTQLEVVRTQLGNTRILAPSSGTVARKWIVQGDIIQPGQPILTLYDLDHIWVTANFEETKLVSIDQGDSVHIAVDAYPSREFLGTVVLIGAAAASQFSLIPPNNASGNFTKVTQRVPVKISIAPSGTDNPHGRIVLLPGMSVEVKIRVKEK